MDIKDFGSRLRQERLTAGLSQSDLASGIMSPSHISLLESGQRSPSPELLEQLAERLGVTPKYLSSGPSAHAAESRRKDLLFAEMALKNGDTELAERLLASLVTELDSCASIEFAVQARHLYARALEGLGRLEEASQELRQAISDAELSGLPLEAVEMTITLSGCARESGDYVTAVELLAAAQKTFPAELRQSATYARLLSSAIAIHYLRGDYIRAQHLAEQAMDIFDDRTDPTARAAILWNASLAADANDDTTKALLLAQRAAGLYSEGDDRRYEGELRIAISWLFTRQTPPNVAAAREQLARAEVLLSDSGTLIGRGYLETEMARVEWLDENFEEALKNATSALTRLEGSKDRLQSAHAHLLVARAQISLGHEIESEMNLDAARTILAGMEPSRQNSLAWRELGDIYANQGLKTEAMNAYREALHEAGVPASPMAFSEASKAEKDAGLPSLQ
jgi:transcriptional regulator with XRE-family HTH domain